MPDITMCEGQGCPQRERCWRYTAKPSEFRQAYFVDPPLREDGSCYHRIAVGEGAKKGEA